jgi:hypothetical protein
MSLENDNHMNDSLFNTGAAADFLNEAIPGKTPGYWRQRLINARRSDRSEAFVLPFSTVGKAVFYEEADLQQFIEFEKSRQLGKMKLSGRAAEALRAFGIGEAGGGSQGRRFKDGSVNLQATDDGSGVFVQTIISEPLMVFAMTPEQAIAFGTDLVDVGQAGLRIRSTRQTTQPELDMTQYKTITDNDTELVRRRIAK